MKTKPKAVNEKEVLRLLTDVLRRLDRLEEQLGVDGTQGRSESDRLSQMAREFAEEDSDEWDDSMEEDLL